MRDDGARIRRCLRLVDIPSFFKKADFYGVLLPGYLAVTLFLLLFRPDVLFNPTPALSFDLFSAVVFVIFGPAVGLGLQQLHRRLVVMAFAWRNRTSRSVDKGEGPEGPRHPTVAVPVPPRGRTTPRGRWKSFFEDYARVRLSAKDEEKGELDLAESQYDFSVSIGMALVGLGIDDLATKGIAEWPVALVLFVVGVIFLAGGYLEWEYGYSPVINRLIAKYPG